MGKFKKYKPSMNENAAVLKTIHPGSKISKLSPKKNGSYSCAFCTAVLPDESSLKKHKLFHFNRYYCTICYLHCKSPEAFQEHIIQHKNKKIDRLKSKTDASKISCPLGEGSSQGVNIENVYEHINLDVQDESNSSEDSWPLSERSIQFENLESVNEEINKTAQDNKSLAYSCFLCNSSFPDESSKTRHELFHLAKYVCPICDVIFKSEDEFQKHIIQVHRHKKTDCAEEKSSTIGSNSCLPPEGSGDFQSVNVKENKEILDATPNEYVTYTCLLCDKAFSNESSKKQHELNHLSIFRCESCNIVYKNTAEYKKHIQMHSHNERDSLERVSNEPEVRCHISNQEKALVKSLYKKCDAWMEHFGTIALNESAFPVLDFRKKYHIQWLLRFVERSKCLAHPILSNTVSKIAHVHKSLFVHLLQPEGTVCSKEDYDNLFKINEDLNQILENLCNSL